MAKTFFTAEWFPYYWERFEESDHVALMSLTDEGAYHRAIRLAWNLRSLPSDPELMAAKIQKRCTAKTAARILRSFVPDPQNPRRVIHPVVEEIREAQERKYLNRVKGGKASVKVRNINAANKDTSSITEQCLNNTPAHIEIENKRVKKEEDKSYVFVGGEFLETVMDGLRKRFNLNTLRDEQGWCTSIGWAEANNFAPEAFLECFDLMAKQKWRKGRITPTNVADNLPELAKLRTEIKEQDGTSKQRATPNQTTIEDRVESIGLTEVQYLQ